MRGQSGAGIIASFHLPPGAPAEVAAAQEEFDRLGETWARVTGELQDSEAAVEVARAEDIGAAAEAYTEGKDVEQPDRREREALAKVTALRAALRGAEHALDEAGNALLAPIEEAREPWTTRLTAERDEAAARYDEAIKEARAALEDLGRATSALAWLADFDADAGRVGQINGWHGKPHPLVVEDLRGRQEDPRQLLELAAKAPAALQSREERRAARQAEEDAKRAARAEAVVRG